MKLILIASPQTNSAGVEEEDQEDAGKWQAAVIASDVLHRFEVSAVYASPEPVAVEAATAIAAGCGLVLADAEGLRALPPDLMSSAVRDSGGMANQGEQHL